MFCLKRLDEKTRQELISKQRRETPERIKRSESYSISDTIIEPDAFINNWCVITCTVNGNGSSYKNAIAFKNVISDLKNEAILDNKHTVNAKLIQKSLKKSLDSNDIYIDCECKDMTFRYAYHATQDKYKWGKLQNSNGKGIRNPNNDIGSMCKHVYVLLRSNKFMEHISDKIMRTIIANLDILIKKYDINLEEFVVNSAHYDKLLQMNIDRDEKGKFKKIEITDDNNDNVENEEDNNVTTN